MFFTGETRRVVAVNPVQELAASSQHPNKTDNTKLACSVVMSPWVCKICTFAENTEDWLHCEMCLTVKDEGLENIVYWTCKSCGYDENEADYTRCNKCDVLKGSMTTWGAHSAEMSNDDSMDLDTEQGEAEDEGGEEEDNDTQVKDVDEETAQFGIPMDPSKPAQPIATKVSASKDA